MDSVHYEYEQISLRPNEKKLVGNSASLSGDSTFMWLLKEARKQG